MFLTLLGSGLAVIGMASDWKGMVAGMATGLLGLGGGLVMVPLMVQLMQVPIHLAIRFSTLAVLTWKPRM